MRRLVKTVVIVAFASGVLASVGLIAQTTRTSEAQLKAAQHKEEVGGDLPGAIEQYRTIAKGADRAPAAPALLAMARCFQKLGDAAYIGVLRWAPDSRSFVGSTGGPRR